MAKTPEFKAPQDVRIKQPESAGLFGEEPTVAAISNAVDKTPEIEWLDIPWIDASSPVSRYPHNGQPVWLTPDGSTEYLAMWRVTREFRDGRFQPTAFWAIHNGGGQKIGFDPLGYRKFEEPIYAPRKRA